MSDITDLAGKVKVNEWLQGMYAKGIQDQKSELKTLFTRVQDQNLTDEQRTALLESKTSLGATVEQLEAELAVLEEQMTAAQNQIDSLSKQVADLLSTVKSQTNTIESEQRKHAQNVVEEVMNKRQRDPNYGADEMVSDMFRGMRKFENNSGYKNLQKNISLLSGTESKIKNLVESASSLIDSKNNLEKRYGVTKSTYDLIAGNLAAITLKDANFSNADLGANKPIFSATKLETLIPYFDNTSINVKPGENSNYKEGATRPAPTLESINTKYKDYLKTKKTNNVDIDSYKNAAVKNLEKAMDKGLLTDLRLAGITGNDLSKFLADNFSGANIKIKDGKLQIPYGHGADAKKVYTRLTNFVNSQTLGNDTSKWSSDFFKGVKNDWNKDKGNTLDSNKQIKALADNFDTIAASMKEKGFTFKEAMYAMFNQDNGLFKDSGIVYDLNKQNDTLKYFIEYAGDDDTAKAYKNVAATIYKNWGVKPTMCIDYSNIDNEPRHDGQDTPTTEPDRIDPMTFVKGDTEYAFIIDKNGDGKFNDALEFVGGNGSRSWLDDLKSLDSNGDGVLEGDELKNLQLLKSKIHDNAKDTANGNAHTETTNIGYEFTNAKDLGIERIDLNGLEANRDTGRTDVNNSKVFEDSFKFTLNGEEITAKRKDDTESYMNTVYGNTYGARLDNKSGLTDGEVDAVIEKDYGEFDEFANKFKDFESNIQGLNAWTPAIDQTIEYVDKTRAQSDNEYKAIITKGQNRAEALYGRMTNWDSIQNDVKAAARERGIDPSSGDFILQAKGIYITGAATTPESIVDEYQRLQDVLSSSETRRQNSTVAFNALIECAKNRISVKLNDIMRLLEEGKVKTVEDVVKYYTEQNQPEQEN